VPPTSLSTLEISVDYGGLRAVDQVSLEIFPGRVTGLIGPNGAGKTTFIDALTGFLRCNGRVVLGETDISELAPHRRAKAGLLRTWQSLELFDELTVRQNVMVGAEPATVLGVAFDVVHPNRASGTDSVD
jgi:branched-chain amino acid transport system ATP-binding protein